MLQLPTVILQLPALCLRLGLPLPLLLATGMGTEVRTRPGARRPPKVPEALPTRTLLFCGVARWTLPSPLSPANPQVPPTPSSSIRARF